MPNLTFAQLRGEYADLWRSMRLNPDRVGEFSSVAARLMRGVDRYKAVEKATGVPAALIAILHERESGANFNTYLGNGDPLNRPTVNVPEGRGPFRNFEEGAIDALKLDGLLAIKTWSLELMLFYAEKFNGFGYRLGPMFKGQRLAPMRSPYLWGGTNHQQIGKYVRDGVFDPNVMDSQLGAAGILFRLFMSDTSLFRKAESGEGTKPAPVQPVPAPVDPPPPKPVLVPAPAEPAGPITGGAGGAVVGGLGALQSGLPWWAVLLIAAALGGLGFLIVKQFRKG